MYRRRIGPLQRRECAFERRTILARVRREPLLRERDARLEQGIGIEEPGRDQRVPRSRVVDEILVQRRRVERSERLRGEPWGQAAVREQHPVHAHHQRTRDQPAAHLALGTEGPLPREPAARETAVERGVRSLPGEIREGAVGIERAERGLARRRILGRRHRRIVGGHHVIEISGEVHRLVVAERHQHAPARGGRLGLEAAQELDDTERFRASIDQVARTDEVGLSAGPVPAVIDEAGGPQDRLVFGERAVHIADRDDARDATARPRLIALRRPRRERRCAQAEPQPDETAWYPSKSHAPPAAGHELSAVSF